MDLILTCPWRLSLFMAAIFGGDSSSVDFHYIGGSASRRLVIDVAAMPDAPTVARPFRLFCVFSTMSMRLRLDRFPPSLFCHSCRRLFVVVSLSRWCRRRSPGFISVSLSKQVLTPDTTRRCEYIVPQIQEDQRPACSQRAVPRCLGYAYFG